MNRNLNQIVEQLAQTNNKPENINVSNKIYGDKYHFKIHRPSRPKSSAGRP